MGRTFKSGSTRTLIGTNYKDRWFFLFGFSKNERDNIALNALTALQEVAKTLSTLDDRQIEVAITDGELLEIHHDDETQKPYS